MKLHFLTIIGAVIASAATVFFLYLSGQEFLGAPSTVPYLFLALLLVMILIAAFTWFRPAAMPIWLAFLGIMWSTYNGANSYGSDFWPAVSTGLPFVLAAILVWSGTRISRGAD